MVHAVVKTEIEEDNIGNYKVESFQQTNNFLNFVSVLDDDINLENIQNNADKSNICSNATQVKEEIEHGDVKVEIEEDNIGKYKL